MEAIKARARRFECRVCFIFHNSVWSLGTNFCPVVSFCFHFPEIYPQEMLITIRSDLNKDQWRSQAFIINDLICLSASLSLSLSLSLARSLTSSFLLPDDSTSISRNYPCYLTTLTTWIHSTKWNISMVSLELLSFPLSFFF